MRKLLCIIGTRPEAIKMAPVIRALQATSWARVTTMVSGQHRELLRQALAAFDIKPDVDLDVMTRDQSLARLTARLFEGFEPVLRDHAPDMVLAQGDTTTVMAAAVTCHYLQIPFAHVEAGLRSGNLQNPFPEETNRIFAAVVADLHFAPTRGAKENLLREGVAADAIVISGNTVIDALQLATRRARSLPWPCDKSRRMILLTAHRRESFGPPLKRVLAALRDVVAAHEDLELVFPVHPNPAVRAAADELLAGRERIHLVDPLSYEDFVAAMQRADIVVTDSGGVQEEAPALGKPVLVIRDETERPEAMEAGVALLVGTDGAKLKYALAELLENENAYRSMARGISPYGDGKAAMRIVDALESRLGLAERRRLSDFDWRLLSPVQASARP